MLAGSYSLHRRLALELSTDSMELELELLVASAFQLLANTAISGRRGTDLFLTGGASVTLTLRRHC
jgi:hypothetical protein